VASCYVLRIARIGYQEALELQLRILERVRAAGAEDGVLLLLEHEPVVTIGRSGTARHLRVPREELARRGIALHETNRGGDITYHGPGQLVGYPILYLPEGRRDVHRFLRSIEEVLIRALRRFGIEAKRVAGYTGVWVEPSAEGGVRNAECGDERPARELLPAPHSADRTAKIAAIGVAFRRWTSHHGFALNVATDLSAFGLIVPCGIAECPVTSMQRLLGHAPERRAVEDALIAEFLREFAFASAEECPSAHALLARLPPPGAVRSNGAAFDSPSR